MTEFTTDRRTFMGGLAGTSLFGLQAARSGIGGPAPSITDASLFEQGSSEVHLTIDGIDPEARDADYIEAYAWEWDMTVPEDLNGLPSIGAMNVLKVADQATPQLMESLVFATEHTFARLSVFTTGLTGRSTQTLRITMEPVRVVAVQDEGRVDLGVHPESVALVFQSVTVEHPESGYTFQWNGFEE